MMQKMLFLVTKRSGKFISKEFILLISFLFIYNFSNSLVAETFNCEGSIKTGAGKTGAGNSGVGNLGQEMLTKFQDKFSSITVLESKFTQVSYLSALDLKEESSGNLILKKPGLIKWVYEQPEEQYYLLKHGEFTHYSPLDMQARISNLTKKELSKIPVGILLGLSDLKDIYDLRKYCKNKFGLIFKLENKDSQNNIQKLSVLLNAENLEIKGLESEDLSGNLNQILLKSFLVNKQVSDTSFQLKIPEDVSIIQ